jgi:hypothetical protein
MKFDRIELERIVQRSLHHRPPQWRPASHNLVRAVEGAVFGAIVGYWLLGLAGIFM